MKFKHVLSECESKEWISPKLNNGEFDYWLVLRVIDMRKFSDADPEHPCFYGDLSAVAPSQMKPPRDRPIEEIEDLAEEERAAIFFENGEHVPLWARSDNNPLEIMMRGVLESDMIELMFGLYMDRPVNRMGTSGWKWMRGEL